MNVVPGCFQHGFHETEVEEDVRKKLELFGPGTVSITFFTLVKAALQVVKTNFARSSNNNTRCNDNLKVVKILRFVLITFYRWYF